MIKPRGPVIVELHLGPLPVEVINRTLDLELEPGDGVLSRAAQIHALRSHRDDYADCQPHVASVIGAPLYIGDDFKNPGKIELVARVRAIGSLMLVAVKIEMDANGRYNVTSFYPIGDKKAEGRRDRGFLKIARDA